jgi:hypothetical protein
MVIVAVLRFSFKTNFADVSGKQFAFQERFCVVFKFPLNFGKYEDLEDDISCKSLKEIFGF